MAKYALIFHGGGMAETEADQAEVMAAWGAWMEGLGAALKDPGNAIGAAATINSDGSVAPGGGANPASGYTLIEADSLDAAVALAKNNPILHGGGSIEVAETIDM
jgi:hypothetical protein